MAKISARTATLAKWAVVPVALLVSGAAVSQASYSAFSATSESPVGNWNSGTVALNNSAENVSGSALYSATNLKPGDSGYKCVVVTSSGSLASTVKLYATPTKTAANQNLSPWINVAISEGTGKDSNCSDFAALVPAYTGTLAAFGKDKTDFVKGVGTWAPGAGTVSRTYQIKYTLNAEAPNTVQGGSASMGFTWEAQNS